MGACACFPLGPFSIAAQRNVKMLAVFVMKESIHKYHIHVKKLSVPCDTDKRTKAKLLAQNFAKELELIIRRYPAQWFNYYDFWGDERP